jgi:nicotinamidase-related amidase
MSARTALLVIGLQRKLWGTDCAQRIPTQERIRVLPAIATQVAAARAAGVIVVHCPELALPGGRSDSPAQQELRRALGEDEPPIVGSIAGDYIADFTPRDGEFVVPRRRDSAVTDTRLGTLLRSHGVRSVRLVGGETDRAILATALSLRDADYVPTVVLDAVASRSHDGHHGAVMVLRATVLTESAAD